MNNNRNSSLQELKSKLWELAEEMRGKISSLHYSKIIMFTLLIKHISQDWDKTFPKLDKMKDLNEIEELSNLSHYYLNPKYRWKEIIKESQKDSNNRNLSGILIGAVRDIEKNHPKILSNLGETKYFKHLDKSKNQTLIKIIQLIQDFDVYERNSKFSLVSEIYEYFIGEFSIKTAQDGGEFFTPVTIIDLIIAALDLKLQESGTDIYDPASGAGAMLIKSYSHFLEKHSKEKLQNELMLYGQEINDDVWLSAKYSFISWGIPLVDTHKNQILGETFISTLTNDLHDGNKFNYILANPPFNLKKFEHEEIKDEEKWPLPLPDGTANYAWLQHILYSMKEDKKVESKSACVLTSTTLSSENKKEKNYRKLWVDNDLVEAIILLPERLFVNTTIPSCIWFFNKNKKKNKDKVLFIDLRNKNDLFIDISKSQAIFSEEGVKLISKTFKKFRNGEEIDEVGFAKTVTNEEVKNKDYNLSSNVYLTYEKEILDIETLKSERASLKLKLKENQNDLKKLFKKVECKNKEIEELMENDNE